VPPGGKKCGTGPQSKLLKEKKTHVSGLMNYRSCETHKAGKTQKIIIIITIAIGTVPTHLRNCDKENGPYKK
jgi:hypothetical protein